MNDDPHAPADREIEKRLHAMFDREQPPPGLWTRILESAPANDGTGRFAQRWRPALAAALAAIAVLGLVVGGTSWMNQAGQGNEQASLPGMLASEFATFVASGRTFDISSSNSADLHAWFSERMPSVPPGPPARPEAKLAGGRLCNIAGMRVAAYMYEHDGVSMSLYLTKNRQHPIMADTVPRIVNVHPSYGVATWEQGGWRYSAVADLPEARLIEIARRFSLRG